MLIPTKHRDPLPKALSYPLGAEALSTALASAPQVETLELYFHDKPTIFRSQFQQLVATGARLPFLRAEYWRHPGGTFVGRHNSDPSLYGETWSLRVFPVPKQHRHAVKTATLASGLSAVLTWLSAEHPSTWLVGRHSIELSYSFAAGTASLFQALDELPGQALPGTAQASPVGAA